MGPGVKTQHSSLTQFWFFPVADARWPMAEPRGPKLQTRNRVVLGPPLAVIGQRVPATE